MKFLRSVLPHIAIALNVSLLVVIYLDLRNPMMGFLSGAPFLTLAALCCAASITCAAVLYSDWRKGSNQKENSSNISRKISNNT